MTGANTSIYPISYIGPVYHSKTLLLWAVSKLWLKNILLNESLTFVAKILLDNGRPDI